MPNYIVQKMYFNFHSQTYPAILLLFAKLEANPEFGKSFGKSKPVLAVFVSKLGLTVTSEVCLNVFRAFLLVSSLFC